MKQIRLGIPGVVQESNASLAVALVQEHLHDLKFPPLEITSANLPPEIISGLESARWPGRFETRVEEGITWYCDGAHTPDSVVAATQWHNSV